MFQQFDDVAGGPAAAGGGDKFGICSGAVVELSRVRVGVAFDLDDDERRDEEFALLPHRPDRVLNRTADVPAGDHDPGRLDFSGEDRAGKVVCPESSADHSYVQIFQGNIFRAFQANVVQDLLNKGDLDRGLVVAEGYDYEIVEKMNHPHDDYSILVTLKANGTVEKTVVGSVMESLALDSEDDAQFSRLKEIFSAASLQMATFTITEKGYNLYGSDGNFMPAVAADMAAGPQKPASYIGKVASLLYARFLAGEKPIAMVSMDNCSHNGDKLAAAITAFAEPKVLCLTFLGGTSL